MLYRRGTYLLNHLAFSEVFDGPLKPDINGALRDALDGIYLLNSIAPSRIIQTWNEFGPVL